MVDNPDTAYQCDKFFVRAEFSHVEAMHTTAGRRRGIGFIALAGVAAETGVIMLIYLDQAFTSMVDERQKEGRPLTERDLDAAIIEGAVERVRPKMMTVSAIMAGLLPTCGASARARR